MTHQGLSLTEREADDSPWIAVALTLAMNGALIAALSGYDTAEPDHIFLPVEPVKVRAFSALLYRASSPQYLSDPERLERDNVVLDNLHRLVRTRNHLLHGIAPIRSVKPEEARDALALVKHLTVSAPSFPESVDPLNIALLKDLIQRLETRFKAEA